MNKYIAYFTSIKNGKRHTHYEEFHADDKYFAEKLIRSQYKGVEIISIELVI